MTRPPSWAGPGRAEGRGQEVPRALAEPRPVGLRRPPEGLVSPGSLSGVQEPPVPHILEGGRRSSVLGAGLEALDC